MSVLLRSSVYSTNAGVGDGGESGDSGLVKIGNLGILFLVSRFWIYCFRSN